MSKTKIVPGEIYHLYNRGVEKRNIFMNKRDYDRFIELLYFCNSTKAVRLDDLRKSLPQGLTLRSMFGSFDRDETLVELLAYCLMPNHFHLLLKETEHGGASRFMQKLTTAYTMYFNIRHTRSGALLQGTYKTQHIDTDRYLKYVLSYIHLNPIKRIEPGWKENGITDRSKAKKYLSAYPYSSFLDYTGTKRPENHIVSLTSIQDYYDASLPKDFKTSVEEWLEYSQG